MFTIPYKAHNKKSYLFDDGSPGVRTTHDIFKQYFQARVLPGGGLRRGRKCELQLDLQRES
jgi:hypothetical protein